MIEIEEEKDKNMIKQPNNITLVNAAQSHKETLLQGSTNKSTQTSLTRFHEYNIHNFQIQINWILTNQTNLSVQETMSFIVFRAGLNYWFKGNKLIDIVSNNHLMQTNLVFNDIPFKTKKKVKAQLETHLWYITRGPDKIGVYFLVYHVTLA